MENLFVIKLYAMPLLIDLFGVCMQLHEIILSVLGIILFIAAIIFTALKRDTKLLIIMYLISLVMIAFPALSKIAFADVTLEVQRLQCINNKLADNPADSSLQNEAKKKIEDIKKDGLDSSNVATVVTVASTNALLGDSVKAVNWVNKGLAFDANNVKLLQLKEKLLTPRVQVEMQINKVKENPADSAAVKKLKKDISVLQQQPHFSTTHSLTTLSKANMLLGDTAKAIKQVDSALRFNPKNAEAIMIKKNTMINRLKKQ
jgi:hypothetical protein